VVGPLDGDGLAAGVPGCSAGGGVGAGRFDFAAGSGEDRRAVDAGERASEVVGYEGEDVGVGVVLGVVLLGGGEVEVERDIHETACGGEAELGAHGDGV